MKKKASFLKPTKLKKKLIRTDLLLGINFFLIMGLIIAVILINNKKRSNYFNIPRQIVIDWSPYQDLLSAANAENSIDWNRKNNQHLKNICTISFAAAELKYHLEQCLFSNIIAKLPKDFNGEPSIILMLDSDPRIKRFLSLEEIYEAKQIAPQGYMIKPKSPHLIITSSSSIGILYGIYGLLEHLGFRWFAPSSLWKYIPTINKNKALRWQKICENPSFEYRGFWNWGPPDQDFLLWAVRNRFNLIGSIKPALASKLGFYLWAGGHTIILKVLTSDPSLFQKYPQWFGLKNRKRQPIKSQDSYFNPCFSNIEMANYTADYIANKTKLGDYHGISFLNIWPNDARFASYYCQCEDCRALGNLTDQLLFFYSNILNRLRYLQATPHIKTGVKICGLSYYATWNLPDLKYLKYLSNDYFHIFYLNQRSFSEPILTKHHKCENNVKIATAIKHWMELGTRTKVKFGVCEYYNYSVYGGLAKTFQDIIPADVKAYHDLGCRFFAYMHPLNGDPGPRRLTNRLLSTLTWNIQLTGENVNKDYFEKMYPEIENELREIYSLLDNALSNIKEMFGEDSLSYNLFQEHYWSSPPYTENQILEHIPKYLEGGSQYLPGKFSSVKDYRVSFVGLEQSIVQLQQCIDRLEEIFHKSSLDSKVCQRLAADIQWFRTSYFRYNLLWNLAKWRLLKTLSPDSPRLEIFAREFQKSLNFLKFTPLLNQTISPVNQRNPAIGWLKNTKVIIPK